MNVIAFYWYQITKISFVIGSQHPHYLGVLDLANMNTCHSPSINADNGKKILRNLSECSHFVPAIKTDISTSVSQI